MPTTDAAPALDKTLDVLETTRRLLGTVTEGHDADELTRVPTGFNNHLLWHLGHLVVTQQTLCYRLAGLPMTIDTSLVEPFRKGSSPRDWPDDYVPPSRDELMTLLRETARRLRSDYAAGIFTDFERYETSAGVELTSIEDAIVFNNYHEGIHLGSMLALRRALAAA